MQTIQPKHGLLQKVSESLYRYSSNDVYYARIKVDGKEIKRSVQTTDRTLARRNLAALKDELRQINRSQGRLTLAELANRYLWFLLLWLRNLRESNPVSAGMSAGAQSSAEYAKVFAVLIIMAAFFSTLMILLFKVWEGLLVWKKGIIKW